MFFIILRSYLAYALPFFYHTSSEILSSLDSLACPQLSVIHTKTIHAYHLKSQASCKSFLLFGEHPRELISTELGFHIIKEACSGNLNILEYSDIYLIVNANPFTRTKVENGEYCLRGNPNNVDINRN